jgi:predicted enzyme involved in methoxymalonyl-ACP biosynthesis
MLDGIIERARTRNIERIVGYYFPTTKNGMVADHYEKLGYSLVSRDEAAGHTVWSLEIGNYAARSRHIQILEPVHG